MMKGCCYQNTYQRPGSPIYIDCIATLSLLLGSASAPNSVASAVKIKISRSFVDSNLL